MKERPILFSSEMVQAILESRKSQTRRVIKPQPPEGVWFYRTIQNHIEWISIDIMTGSINDETDIYKCPYGQPGDKLWVREMWHKHSDDDEFCAGKIHYRATEICVGTKWHPSIFMPRWASRITLEITNIRVERVQDISEADAIAEGTAPSIVGADLDYLRYRAGYQTVWDSINAKRGYGWDVNPWVWVVEFKRID